MVYSVRDLCFSYRKDVPVLQNLSLNLEDGELLTILGSNGSGKSTLFGCMLGLLAPDSGSIELCGENITRLSPRKIASLAGYVPQAHSPTFDYTVSEFVLMGCAAEVGLLSHPGARERERAEAAVARLGLEELKDRAYTQLSGGERQLVTIARAIASQPRVILFDEPTAHLDFGNQIKVLRVIRSLSEQGFAVVVTTHDPNHALLLGGKTALFTGRGDVLTGKTQDLITGERLKELYGTEITVLRVDELDRNVCLCPKL